MVREVWDWFSERWPIRPVVRWSLEEKIVGGSSFAYTLGSVNIFLFLILAVTGVWELLFYVPTTDHAYDSTMYLRLNVPFGWLVHGLHYWAAQAFVVVVSLHVARVFVWGAYKAPRQLTWLSGVALLLLVLAMVFTGALLPWDELGYWAAEVGTSIAATTPLVGDLLVRVIRGGQTMGQMTLSRFFGVHVAILPALLAGIMAFHVVAFRQYGSVGPWVEERRKRSGWFWPDQVMKDLLVVSLVFVILVGLSAFWPAPITGPADPNDTSITPKPEWSFLFLYQALKAFEGPLEPVGTVGVPIILVLILLLLPFYDRRPERAPARRKLAMTLAGLLVAWLLAMTIWGYYSNPAAAGGLSSSGTPPDPPPALAAAPANPTDEPPPPGSVVGGSKLFQSQGCAVCHSIGGQRGGIGPDLSNEGNKGRSRDWIIKHIQDPKSHDPKSLMPSFNQLSKEQVSSLADFLLAQKGGGAAPAAQPSEQLTPAGSAAQPASTIPKSGQQGPPGAAALMYGDPEHGGVLFTAYCQRCHGVEGKGGVPNPGSEDGRVPTESPMVPELASKNPLTFAENVDRFIEHGSIPEGPHPAITMPDFGVSQSLTQPQIAQIICYILKLNGVDRAEIIEPGVSPPVFFGVTVAAFAILCLAIGFAWHEKRTSAAGREEPPQPKAETERSQSKEASRAAAEGEVDALAEAPSSTGLLGYAIAVMIVVAIIGGLLAILFSQFITAPPLSAIPAGILAAQGGEQGAMKLDIPLSPSALDDAPANARSESLCLVGVTAEDPIGFAAAFVHRFMPRGNPYLNEEEALNAGALVISKPRPKLSSPSASRTGEVKEKGAE